MPRNLFLPILALALAAPASPSARAEFLPGPEHAFRQASLKISAASGSYESTISVQIVQLRNEESSVSAFLVELDGEPHRFELTSTLRSPCGYLYVAREEGTVEDGTKSTLTLEETGCREATDARWEASLLLEHAGGSAQLRAEGEPTFVSPNP